MCLKRHYVFEKTYTIEYDIQYIKLPKKICKQIGSTTFKLKADNKRK